MEVTTIVINTPPDWEDWNCGLLNYSLHGEATHARARFKGLWTHE